MRSRGPEHSVVATPSVAVPRDGDACLEDKATKTILGTQVMGRSGAGEDGANPGPAVLPVGHAGLVQRSVPTFERFDDGAGTAEGGVVREDEDAVPAQRAGVSFDCAGGVGE